MKTFLVLLGLGALAVTAAGAWSLAINTTKATVRVTATGK
jgi:hypothetical protein